jgi:hypothetical protein
MSSTRRRIVWGVLLWTLLLLGVAILVAGQAMSSLYSGQQACFFNFPAVACPGGDDPATARLTFAFFGVPAIWLLGILVGFVGLGIRGGRRRID